MEQNNKTQGHFEKKSERLDIRVSHKKKQEFTDACHDQGDTPSNAVRRFITSYTRRSNYDNLGAAIRTSPLRRILGIRGLIGFATIIMLAYGGLVGKRYVLKANETRITDKAFDIYDHNNNGLIELGEIAPNDFHLHRVLNIDGQDGITREEFVTHSTMIWRYVDPDNFQVIENKFSRFKQKSVTRTITAIRQDGKPYKPSDNTKMKKYIIVNGEPVELTSDNIILENVGATEGNTDGNYKYLRKNGGLPNFSSESFKTKIVKFDLRNPDKLELTVYEQQSHNLISKSISVHQRSVSWVEGRKTPELVVGMGREMAVLTKELQIN